ncbi:MAG: anthranilate/aminodeoxychorismate synthase component II [Candidatus Taylorbacteria bacterium CG11_big_fil_rev_8_21_14_0_20_46_11]|uniref:Anthranilate/aminodeoxychorismate synthase component II n=1 Tax=Candidatus Taylorbacteria bacterium CG11_big_fil_rev_8_21_14_0_20_46_11 TaxID=1975025 RepID=A0A2H0KD70_9BACT|nr:MAG: anthranilate/aminodeoxychorismate synthase component II [Candidatus Taylorbacteria bacterium CG11_big_fil_rev_8_21_14_0_20_46_11]
MKVLIIDNFDSFTFNLYQMVGEILLYTKRPYEVDVFRNNEITHSQIKAKKYDRIIISPGPGNPGDAHYFGVCKEVLLGVSHTVPTLGVCIGMQGIAQYYGGKVVPAEHPMHGKTSLVSHDGKGVFAGLPQGVEVMRYHSLIVTDLSKELVVTARVSGETEGEIMGLRHSKYPIEGIQFHPESFATEGGNEMLERFLFSPYRGTVQEKGVKKK